MRNIFITLCIAVLLCAASTGLLHAAMYRATSLKELSQRATFVALVEVQSSRVIPSVNDEFPRTLYSVKLRQSLAGHAPEEFEIDAPGGQVGDMLYSVPDGVVLAPRESFVIFGGERHPNGGYGVLDLGLGCFKLRDAANGHFVESVLPQNAVQDGSTERDFLFRSIPLNDFTHLVGAYARGEDPALPFARTQARIAAAAALSETIGSESVFHWLWVVAPLSLAGVVMWLRRKHKLARAAAWMLCASALLGMLTNNSSVRAFTPIGTNSVWMLNTGLAGRVSDKRIIWHPSVALSRTNPDCFDAVRFAFNKWDNVPNSSLAFEEGAQTSITKAAKDGSNIIAWSSSPGLDFTGNILALTYTRTNNGPDKFGFADCDIIFNDQDFNWGPQGRGNVASVALHEIGHFIGLNHTSDPTTVMFPTDSGLVALSGDEILAAQTLYPGESGASLPTEGPTVEVSASPANGKAPLEVSFIALAKPGPSGNFVTSYTWDFGDGSEPITTTLPGATHTYFARGLYDAMVSATDSSNIPAYSRTVVSVDGDATPQKGTLNLSFGRRPRGSLSLTLFSSKLVGIRAPRGAGQVLTGTFYFGTLARTFSFNSLSGQSVKGTEASATLNFGSGRATVHLQSVDLPNALSHLDFPNTPSVRVPVGLRLGADNNVILFSEVEISVKKVTTSGVSATILP